MATVGTESMQPPRLSSREMLALQLAALGYSPDATAALRRAGVAEVLLDLQAALTALGAVTLHEAIAEAQRRGLIL